MLSFTSSFDLGAPVKGALAAATVIGTVWVVTPASLPFDDQPLQLAATMNALALERYMLQHAAKPVVFVGSSIQATIPLIQCQPDNVASLSLQGGHPASGIETILRVGARPKVLLVEAPTAHGAPDPTLMSDVFPPGYWRIRTAVPPLGSNRNWMVMLYRSLLPPPLLLKWLELPPMSVEEWNKVIESRLEPYRRPGVRATFSIEDRVAALATLLRPLREQGTRVILHSPMDPVLNETSPTKDWLMALKSDLSDLEWFEPPADLPIYRHEGIHLLPGSGLHYFDYLMKRAKLPYEPKCPLPAIFGRN